MPFFIDTSALFKRYQPEKGTDLVCRILEESGQPLYISSISIIEIISNLKRLFEIDNITDEVTFLSSDSNLCKIAVRRRLINPEPVVTMRLFLNTLRRNIDTLPDKIEKTSKLDSRLHGNDGLEVFSYQKGMKMSLRAEGEAISKTRFLASLGMTDEGILR
jgi:hypothetical protein